MTPRRGSKQGNDWLAQLDPLDSLLQLEMPHWTDARAHCPAPEGGGGC